MITSADAWWRLANSQGRIFRVVFLTKTPQRALTPDGDRTTEVIAPAGRTRSMLARLGVHKYTKGVISPESRREEDLEHNVLTCWDLEVFKNLRIHFEDQGFTPFQAMMRAGRKAYRRINMQSVLEIQGVDP